MADINAIASSALSAYSIKQAVTANNVANADSSDFKASSTVMRENKTGGINAAVSKGEDMVDISKEAADMISTGNGFKANLKVLQTSDEMTRELLNIKA